MINDVDCLFTILFIIHPYIFFGENVFFHSVPLAEGIFVDTRQSSYENYLLIIIC